MSPIVRATLVVFYLVYLNVKQVYIENESFYMY